MTTKKQPEPQTGPDEQEVKIGRTPVAQLESKIAHVIGLHSNPAVKGRYDQRLIAIAATQLELGLLALAKARALAGDDQPEEATDDPQK